MKIKKGDFVPKDINNFIRSYKKHNPDGVFFSKETMAFFGESIDTMEVLPDVINYEGHNCYTICSYQKNHPSGARRQIYFFETRTYKYIPTLRKDDLYDR